MSTNDSTFGLSTDDVRKAESRESKTHNGNVPAGSKAAAIQSIVDSNGQNKAGIIEERKANLPLPEQPPRASDFNTADQSAVSGGSGGADIRNVDISNSALRGPATGESAFRVDPSATGTNVQGQNVGRKGVDGIPNDAVAQGSKNKPGLEKTTN